MHALTSSAAQALVPAEADAPFSATYLTIGAAGLLSRRNDAAAR